MSFLCYIWLDTKKTLILYSLLKTIFLVLRTSVSSCINIFKSRLLTNLLLLAPHNPQSKKKNFVRLKCLLHCEMIVWTTTQIKCESFHDLRKTLWTHIYCTRYLIIINLKTTLIAVVEVTKIKTIFILY